LKIASLLPISKGGEKALAKGPNIKDSLHNTSDPLFGMVTFFSVVPWTAKLVMAHLQLIPCYLNYAQSPPLVIEGFADSCWDKFQMRLS
jgi:hypothetical protein